MGTVSGTTPSSVSCKLEGRLLCVGEVDSISDVRTKQNIEPINKNFSIDFIKKVQPKKIRYRNSPDSNDEYGYIAQDSIKTGFGDLIMVENNEEMNEYIDEDGFVSPDDKLFTFTRGQVLPLLHGTIKHLLDRVEELEEKLNLSK